MAAGGHSGPGMDKAADIIALFVIVVAPIIAIGVFWLVHILPEKIAEKRQHPQADAVKVICLLSLVFGGMLWPIAWILAYSKPVLYKLAYGTDKLEHGAAAGAAGRKEPVLGPEEPAAPAASVLAAPQPAPERDEVRELRERLAALEARLAAPAGGTGAA